jgi:hypothetical protein
MEEVAGRPARDLEVVFLFVKLAANDVDWGLLKCGVFFAAESCVVIEKSVRSTMMRSKVRVRQGKMLIRRPNNRTEVL